MMPSTTNGNSNYNHKSKVNIPAWLAKAPAILFWLLVWQAASMKLEQEILLASPVSVVKKLGELVCTGDFWRSAAFSCGRIGAGFVLALALGIVLAILAHRFWVAAALLTPLMAVIKSTPVASFIILCLIWIPSKNLSVFISFLMVLPVCGESFSGIARLIESFWRWRMYFQCLCGNGLLLSICRKCCLIW